MKKLLILILVLFLSISLVGAENESEIGDDMTLYSEVVPIINTVIPNIVPVSLETEFIIIANSPVGNNLTIYEWDFAGDKKVTNDNTIKYTFDNVGKYDLNIKVEDEDGYYWEDVFEIDVKIPKEAASYPLNRKKSALENFTKEFELMSEFEKNMIEEFYDIDSLTDELNLVETAYLDINGTEGYDEDYFDIKERLDDIIIPMGVKNSAEIKKTKALVNIGEISPSYIKSLGGGSYDNALLKETKQAMVVWQSVNLNINISGKVKSIINEDGSTKDLFTSISVDLVPRSELKDVFLVILLPSGVSYNAVTFIGDYNQESVDGAVGIKFDELSAQQTIEFALVGKQEMLLDIFSSTYLDELEVVESTACGNTICEKNLGEDYNNCPEDCKPTGKAIFWIAVFIVGGIVGVFLIWKFYVAIYDLMQQKKFFKKRQEYIDMLIFVSSSLKKEQSEKEIRAKLSKAGWKKEQLDYVLTKALKAYKKLKK